ncbi:MAG TPA: hypothetical protein VFA63_15005 [Pseudonocardiaceae bacterium]|nr:hypothetical protein [Pseudonocardiaceae bacterium]
MPLTSAQQATFRTAVKANQAVAAAYAAKDTDAIAAAYNAVASPDFWIWRANVTKSEYVNNTSQDATVFDWTVFIGRSQGERDAFGQIFMNVGQSVNPSLTQVRQAFADIFSGAGGATVRTHMLATSRKKASIFGKLYAAGTGSTASPATAPTELIDYALTSQDAHDALFDANGDPL